MRAGDEPMMQTRRWILSRGGIANSNTLARFYLAAMNQVPWHATAALPVELANMYELSSWARGTVFALMMPQAKKPTVQVELSKGVRALHRAAAVHEVRDSGWASALLAQSITRS
jgi:squalene cyclase